MPKLEQHHIRYLEIHGEDEIIMLTHAEHKKAHAQDRANGAKPIPQWILDASHSRSPVGLACKAKYNASLKGKARKAKYRQSKKRGE